LAHLCKEKLLRAGFSLETYEDGSFWVYERGPGSGSERLLAACRYCIPSFDEYTFSEMFILQCDFDFRNPILYLDGFIWHLSQRDFADVVRQLSRKPYT